MIFFYLSTRDTISTFHGDFCLLSLSSKKWNCTILDQTSNFKINKYLSEGPSPQPSPATYYCSASSPAQRASRPTPWSCQLSYWAMELNQLIKTKIWKQKTFKTCISENQGIESLQKQIKRFLILKRNATPEWIVSMHSSKKVFYKI